MKFGWCSWWIFIKNESAYIAIKPDGFCSRLNPLVKQASQNQFRNLVHNLVGKFQFVIGQWTFIKNTTKIWMGLKIAIFENFLKSQKINAFCTIWSWPMVIHHRAFFPVNSHCVLNQTKLILFNTFSQ